MIIDANVVVSAVLGRSLSLLLEVIRQGVDLVMPTEQYREVGLVSVREGERQGRDVSVQLQRALELILQIDADYYALHERAARARLDQSERAQRDWPLLALALATGDAVWTNDPDLFGTGVVTWRTTNIVHYRADAPDRPAL